MHFFDKETNMTRLPGAMPKQGDIFEGKINDLSNYDSRGWRRRDITFIKNEIKNGKKYEYPSRRNQITLVDSAGARYTLNITKPETDHSVCIGTPSKLKPWYFKKGFNHGSINTNDKIYFVYTGQGLEFYIFTADEYLSKKGDTGR